ncbi:hypothetical protein A2524_01340 [Candidatus Wolfebacteria bacterium RIFOXYD12_FULL_48_21]|uniref:Prepilin type IV endopeptidase peptidase domain-containing protein n=1 Tax=Candidatus Wolfebacteria bacterium RIFOXYD1_FULL_48_65 TaxID=1802561 RepID=A0A1F8E045_9BACT|nr:MAG: hypothetical protein A2610_00525 [Candidatus Wolfebacteria bacterium RIFOXYD1_FULL_48_65]OGM94452.1 MAG: hypothetical protein A2524_01340 [Candidatus Wolfebacteria bacterium RIFOXYD12_FULL_48_21]OGM97167.1 MAG: hypothetical protein A2532_01995 [Candidatus Wolfebacteria bacterium RIFOXYD2_FULL_48_11]
MAVFFLNPIFLSVLDAIPLVFFVAVIFWAGYVNYISSPSGALRRKTFLSLAFIVIGFRVVFALIKTGLQYYAWAQDPMGKLLLPPIQSVFVFVRYAWTHFWINPLIAVGVGLFVLLLLSVLQRKNERFFDTGEVELGMLLTIVVGWPHFVLFFPLTFLLVVMLSAIRGIFFKEQFTTLGLPFFIASIIALFFGIQAIIGMHLTALVI